MALGFNGNNGQAPATTTATGGQAPAQAPRRGRREQQEQEDAVGFLNLRIKDAAGNYHSIRATIPLLDSVRIHSALVTKAKANGPDFTFELEGTVNLVTNEEIVL